MEKILNIEDLFRICKMLSSSQGFYGRLLDNLNNADDETLEKLNNEIEKQSFTDDIELIMWLEC